jgi:hypothetical protein
MSPGVLDDLRLQVAERHIRRLTFQRDALWFIALLLMVILLWVSK